MDTLQALIELRIQHKYTLVYFGRNGYLNRVHFTLKGTGRHRIGSKEMVRLVIKPRNAPIRDVLLDPNNQFVIWNDWVDPNWEMVINTYLKDTSMGALRMARGWAKYDPRYIQKSIGSLPRCPVVWNIKPINKEERFQELNFSWSMD